MRESYLVFTIFDSEKPFEICSTERPNFVRTEITPQKLYTLTMLSLIRKNVSSLLLNATVNVFFSLFISVTINSLSGDHIGTYLGLFNGTICLPQIVAAACGGILLKVVGGSQVSMFIVAGVLLLLGTIAVYLIKEKKNH